MSLEHDALHLAELDRSVVRTVLEGNIEDFGRALNAYVELRKNLKIRLLDQPAVSVTDVAAADVLRKISRGEGLPSDKILDSQRPRLDREVSAGRCGCAKPSISCTSMAATCACGRSASMTATLDDNPSARDFASMLPLDLTIDDYSTDEKIAYLSVRERGSRRPLLLRAVGQPSLFLR